MCWLPSTSFSIVTFKGARGGEQNSSASTRVRSLCIGNKLYVDQERKTTLENHLKGDKIFSSLRPEK